MKKFLIYNFVSILAVVLLVIILFISKAQKDGIFGKGEGKVIAFEIGTPVEDLNETEKKDFFRMVNEKLVTDVTGKIEECSSKPPPVCLIDFLLAP